MKIGFVSEWNLEDPKILEKVFSGIWWHVFREFKSQGDEIEYIGPVKQNLVAKSIKGSTKLLNGLKIFSPPAKTQYHPVFLDQMANQTEQLVSKTKVDVLLVQSSILTSHFKLDVPIVFWRDANFADSYGNYHSNFHPISVEWGHKHEEKAMNRAAINIFSSECSYHTAISKYGIPPEKVAVIPFGANHSFKLNRADIERLIAQRSRDICRLLFIGYAWERKGGDIAVNVCKLLNQAGVLTSLDIVGPNFQVDPTMSRYVKTHGPISKFTSEGSQRLRELLEQSHFLIHPAHAEAYGCVLCEACSFGIPCIASAVGGIPTIVKNGQNGCLLPPNAPASDYVNVIEAIFRNYDSCYIRLAKSAFEAYQERLNWRVAVAKARNLIQRTIFDSASI